MAVCGGPAGAASDGCADHMGELAARSSVCPGSKLTIIKVHGHFKRSGIDTGYWCHTANPSTSQ
jgi:hypothetical protein